MRTDWNLVLQTVTIDALSHAYIEISCINSGEKQCVFIDMKCFLTFKLNRFSVIL